MKHLLSGLALASCLALPCLGSTPLQPNNRARVTAIFISVTLPDGTVKNVSLDPARIEALFFSDRAVSEMLGRFYNQHGQGKILPAEPLMKRFGKDARTMLKGESVLQLNQENLMTLWNTPSVDGVLPGVVLKDPDCNPTQWP